MQISDWVSNNSELISAKYDLGHLLNIMALKVFIVINVFYNVYYIFVPVFNFDFSCSEFYHISHVISVHATFNVFFFLTHKSFI